MKPKTLSLVIFLVFITSMTVEAKDPPRLDAEKTWFDFGTVREGVNVPVRFTVINTGGREVRIQEIRTFAACVQARPLDTTTLSPGESLTLDYIFKSLGYSGASVNKHIEIHYNNTSLSPFKLQVKGRVLPLESFQAPIGELTYNFFVLVDVRSLQRFNQEHIIGAIHVPFENIEKWADTVCTPLSDELIIYLYSENGKKSDEAARLLNAKSSLRNIRYISLVGGLKEWKNQNGRKFLVSGK